MKVIFIHNNFPGQFIHLVKKLSCLNHEIVFISHYKRQDIIIKNIRHLFAPPLPVTHTIYKTYSQKTSHEMFLTGESFASVMIRLKKEKFIPDVVISHPGWGGSLYVKDIFPLAIHVVYCEWFYNKGELFNFFKNNQENPASYAANRHRNFYQVDALLECDVAVSPTNWQYSQYPQEVASKIKIIHDGIDTNYFSPTHDDYYLGEINLKSFQEIVTYTARGLEPYRGFPQFYSAIPFILDARPQCHIIIMADDKSCYSRQRNDGKTWLEAMQSIVPAASSERVHFFKFSNYENYRKILRFSTVHIYLTAPFVLSWSLLEAMSCQCLILASATSPVKEVIKHQENGYLTSFWDSNIIAQDAIKLLQENSHLSNIRFNARKTILEKYDVSKSLAAQLQLIEEILSNKHKLSNTN